MDAFMENWMKDHLAAVKKTFGERVWFVGLQGSRARGEGTGESDIDVVLILDRADAPDLKAYSALLDTLPCREKICGFVGGREELFCWDPAELFQFCRDTVPFLGSLESLLEKVSREDIWRAVRTGACGAYHLCAHNLVHEKDGEILRGICKSAVFTLGAIAFLQTGTYAGTAGELAQLLEGEDRAMARLAGEARVRKSFPDGEWEEMSARVLEWASRWIRKSCEELGRI